MGHREAERQAERLTTQPRAQALDEARQFADRIGDRLEQVRLLESDRPAMEYQTLYHDSRGANQGIAVVPSPLASSLRSR